MGRKFLCMASGVTVEFAFEEDERKCTFGMSFAVKSASNAYTLGAPITGERVQVSDSVSRGIPRVRRRGVTTVLDFDGKSVVFSKIFAEDDRVDDSFALEGDELVCRKSHTSGATALRKFRRAV